MKIVALNIQHGGGTRIDAIVGYLLELEADCIVLSEYRSDDKGLASRLSELGFPYQHTGAQYLKENSVLIASKTPFAAGETSQRLVSASFEQLTLIGVYFPQGEEKRPVFSKIRALANSGNENLLVIGDFNTGKHFIDETANTFACADDFEALERDGLIDVWRSRNPDTKEFTWYSSKGNGFRIDHAFATKRVNQAVDSVLYAHSPRERKITDHSALILTMSPCR